MRRLVVGVVADRWVSINGDDVIDSTGADEFGWLNSDFSGREGGWLPTGERRSLGERDMDGEVSKERGGSDGADGGE